MKKIQNLLARIRQGEDFAQLAQNYSEDPASAPEWRRSGFHRRIGARPRVARIAQDGAGAFHPARSRTSSRRRKATAS